MNYILDACSMIAYLRGEQGSEIIESILLSENNFCIAHAINLCEVYYDFIRVTDEKVAEMAINDLISVGIMVIESIDSHLWKQAGRIKAENRISLADSFALALAIKEGAILVTSDRREFEPIVKKGIYSKILFIR